MSLLEATAIVLMVLYLGAKAAVVAVCVRGILDTWKAIE